MSMINRNAFYQFLLFIVSIIVGIISSENLPYWDF